MKGIIFNSQVWQSSSHITKATCEPSVRTVSPVVNPASVEASSGYWQQEIWTWDASKWVKWQDFTEGCFILLQRFKWTIINECATIKLVCGCSWGYSKTSFLDTSTAGDLFSTWLINTRIFIQNLLRWFLLQRIGFVDFILLDYWLYVYILDSVGETWNIRAGLFRWLCQKSPATELRLNTDVCSGQKMSADIV